MGNLFGVLSVIYVFALIAGLIKPALFRLSSRKKVFIALTGALIASFITGSIASTINISSTPPPISKNSGPTQAQIIGERSYLRLPDNNDQTQVLCLAPNKEIYDKYIDDLLKKDYAAIVDLASDGLFCVHNGSEVTVISTTSTLTQVRVVKGVTDVDSDKVGQSGYTAKEWVVDR